MSKKIASGTLRFVSMFFEIFLKRYEEKNCHRNFEIPNYAFLNI